MTYFSEIESDQETFSALLGDNGVINIEEEFEEDIDGDFAWRTPPGVSRFQKAKNSNVFIHLREDASVRYRTIDTDDDGDKDALDPAKREGDEVFRSLEFLAKKPAGAALSNITGDFGREAGVTTNTLWMLTSRANSSATPIPWMVLPKPMSSAKIARPAPTAKAMPSN